MPMLNAADLLAMFGMEPQQAIGYLQSKGFEITWDWHEADAAIHARAFTVAKAARLDLLEDIRNALIDNFRGGKTLRDFQRELTPLLQAKGWWGKQIIVDSAGNAEKVQLGSPRRLATIYQTNAQSAYMSGRYRSAMAAVKTHPYWMYIAINDSRTRPSHRALNGKVFRWDDPIWQYILPPNGFNCRCRFIALTEREVKARGLNIESSEGNISFKTIDAGVNKRTGEINTSRVVVLRTTDAAGKAIVFSPDAGFSGMPMQSLLRDR
ncbi:MAG TPA: phage minor head protein [Cellvibrio sp.]|nr:phage minor head protein [Cellvibrio sp.]